MGASSFLLTIGNPPSGFSVVGVDVAVDAQFSLCYDSGGLQKQDSYLGASYGIQLERVYGQMQAAYTSAVLVQQTKPLQSSAKCYGLTLSRREYTLDVDCAILAYTYTIASIQTYTACLNWDNYPVGFYNDMGVLTKVDNWPVNFANDMGILTAWDSETFPGFSYDVGVLADLTRQLASYYKCEILSPPFDYGFSASWWAKTEDHALFNLSYEQTATIAVYPFSTHNYAAYLAQSHLNLLYWTDFDASPGYITMYYGAERIPLYGVTLRSPYGVMNDVEVVYSLRGRVISL